MGYNYSEFELLLAIFTCVGIAIGILTVCLVFISDWINGVNKEDINKKQEIIEAEKYDNDIVTHYKTHHRQYEPPVKKENKNDFKVDFNINLTESVVKTEVVYVD